jgi:putative transposase
MALARKSIKQGFRPSAQLLSIMESFRQMTNDCIRIGLDFEKNNDNRTPSMKQLSLLSYGELRRRYGGYSQYALCAISKAAGILSARRKSIKRGFCTKDPLVSKPVLVSSYGFKVANGNLLVRVDSETLESIPLNSHTGTLISDSKLKVCSFTLTEDSMSLCVSKDVGEIGEAELTGAMGVDRNLRNLTVGDGSMVTYYDMTKVVDIGENTRSIIRSFKRADVRIRQQISSKYGKRRSDRTKHLLNQVSKKIVREAKSSKQAIIFEEIRGIRKLYRRGMDRGGHTERG